MSQTSEAFSTSVLSRPWWLHAGNNIKRKVLAIGNIDVDTLVCIDRLSESTSIYLNENIKRAYPESISNFLLLDELSEQYDAIIFSSLQNEIKTETLSLFTDRHLKEQGVIIALEPNNSRLAGSKSSIIGRLWNALVGGREKAVRRALELKVGTVKLFCSHVRDGYIRYSYSPKGFQTNKNTFLFKERLKIKLNRSFLFRLFFNSNLWVITKGERTRDLEQLIKDELVELKAENFSAESKCVGLFYRFGKLILTFSHQNGRVPNSVVVIAMSRNAILQRDNEYNSINEVAKIAALEPYLTSKVEKYSVANFNCYVMSETPGITVDFPNKDLARMTQNVAEVLTLLGLNSQKGADKLKIFSENLDLYVNNIIGRIPSCKSQLIEIVESVKAQLNQESIPMVCMHGDAKLENFVLNKDFKVAGIIDWELTETKSFPLIDLLYLITYNYQSIENVEFNLLFKKIWNNKLEPYESELIKNYCEELGINKSAYRLLLKVYFLHHYGQRYLLFENGKQSIEPFKESLSMILGEAKR